MVQYSPTIALLLAHLLMLAACGGGSTAPSAVQIPPQPQNRVLDLGGLSGGNGFLRVSGAASSGRFGVPVAAGFDLDGDGHSDYAIAGMLASPLGRNLAGQVTVIFGDSQIQQSIDTALPNTNILTVIGDGPMEATGGEIWMSDVTGDGLGDLIIGRPNFRGSAPDRIGAGALTIVVGSTALRDLATSGALLDLRAPPTTIDIVTLTGAAELDRLGFWMRTGDVTGDNIDDIVVGADQQDSGGATNSGAVYLLRGGAHLATNLSIDLANFGATTMTGNILKIEPPMGSDNYHFGATVALADLDENNRSDVLIAASLKRVGGELLAEDAAAGSATGIGGNPFGSVFIVWDDNIPSSDPWPAGLSFSIDNAPMTTTRIDGGSVAGQNTSHSFGEEMIGGLDYNADGVADVFFGDIWGIARSDRDRAGVGHLFFSAANLKGRDFSISDIPGDLTVTTILGPEAGTISNDTTLHGDIDNDGIADLGVASPLANPNGRRHAGTIHILWGLAGAWPALIDLREDMRPDPADFRITDIYGARGEQSDNDRGDTLMYSAAAADMDNDGRIDLIVNEMRGNGIAGDALDVGNLLIISGGTIPKD